MLPVIHHKITVMHAKEKCFDKISPSFHQMQWMMGFLSFWHRAEVRMTRVRVLPWHIFLGLYTYGLAVATAETGLLEKLTFLQTRRNVYKSCPESMVVNSLGLGLALLSGFVIFAAVSPKSHVPVNKPKCLSSWWKSREWSTNRSM